ncbi:MAG: 4-hydroxythreonine-4-phosphate dehydrogenase PdxA [Pseudomonadota bacterium]
MTKPTSKNVSEQLIVTAGEPAGIGPELCLALADTPVSERVVVLTDPAVLEARAKKLSLPISLSEFDPDNPRPGARGQLRVWPLDMPAPNVCGQPDPANARALLESLSMAVRACADGTFDGLVTAPLQKSVINDAGVPFSGHTEFLAEVTGVELPVMLLVANDLRVALATTHLPLADVPAAITSDGLCKTIRVLHGDLRSRFGIAQPEIVVCGLNPHAGEGGHLGHEDQEVIAPAIATCRAEKLNVRGPLPADTAFTPAGGHADAILAMYHDQGLPVLKYAGFGNAVNVTLGLPIVRTSVDHGTALDIAGTGSADTGSFFAAIELAHDLVQR